MWLLFLTTNMNNTFACFCWFSVNISVCRNGKPTNHLPPMTLEPNRLAQLLAEAISKDEDVLQEIQTLIAKKPDDRKGPTGSSSPRPNAGPNPQEPLSNSIAVMKRQLLEASLAPKTLKFYQGVWSKFQEFVSNLNSCLVPLPSLPDTVASYIAHLHMAGLAPTTISSYLSAITFFHTSAGFPDPCNNQQIRRMTLGCRKVNKSIDTRLPLLLQDIENLTSAVNHIYLGSPYNISLYKAIILQAFFGFFRMGELLPNSNCLSTSVVQRHHVTISNSTIHLQLHNHKTNKGKPLSIIIKQQPHPCPVKALQEYLNFRTNRLSSVPSFS